MKINRQQPAFPAQAAQDNLGKIFTPFPGFTQYEYVMLQFALKGVNEELDLPESLDDTEVARVVADAIMQGAKILTDAFFKAVTPPEETTGAKIINL
jgi:hypothetical protein